MRVRRTVSLLGAAALGLAATVGSGLTQSPPAAATGLQIVTAGSASDHIDSKGAYAFCPTGKRVIGIGGWVGATQGRAVLDEIAPATNLQTVRASAYEAEGGNGQVVLNSLYPQTGLSCNQPHDRVRPGRQHFSRQDDMQTLRTRHATRNGQCSKWRTDCGATVEVASLAPGEVHRVVTQGRRSACRFPTAPDDLRR
ncbi:hypothetical protein [Thermomonospora amylolytica]|uniref:hypothetical protein n=1 Tax=Thermomonospora amylolytica TaxID=1411117 RepID=UPI000E6C7D44|nr:hypothetical protein [Thermomonospora amylolytica]